MLGFSEKLRSTCYLLRSPSVSGVAASTSNYLRHRASLQMNLAFLDGAQVQHTPPHLPRSNTFLPCTCRPYCHQKLHGKSRGCTHGRFRAATRSSLFDGICASTCFEELDTRKQPSPSLRKLAVQHSGSTASPAVGQGPVVVLHIPV